MYTTTKTYRATARSGARLARPAWVAAWCRDVFQRTDFSVSEISLKKSSMWRYDKGAISHRSGRFFSIVGGRWQEGKRRLSQPFILQPEVGTLAFVQRTHQGRCELLVQAKLEPGNVGPVQLAPTCQATESNLARVHGGNDPPGAHLLAHTEIVHTSLQSEQGTRFLDKRNRNVLARCNARSEDALDDEVTHKWVAVDDLLKLLPVDFSLNTDARSVLVSSPWQQLTGRLPFSRHTSGFGVELAASAAVRDRITERQVFNELGELRATAPRARIVPLNEVDQQGAPFVVRHINVMARGREVSTWDQPIVDSRNEGAIDLLLGRRNGILHVLLEASSEPGLCSRVELGPSYRRAPGERLDEPGSSAESTGKVLIDCRQSEEGGRFYRDVNRFRVIDAGEATTPRSSSSARQYWLPLGSIQHLLLEGGWLTNEARSALALLLTWL